MPAFPQKQPTIVNYLPSPQTLHRGEIKVKNRPFGQVVGKWCTGGQALKSPMKRLDSIGQSLVLLGY